MIINDECDMMQDDSKWKELDKHDRVRTFDTGANRDTAEGKLDYEGFLSPKVLKQYAQYMHTNRHLNNGDVRDSDNWQKGFGEEHFAVCIKSMLRHVMDVWLIHRGNGARSNMEDALCGVIFNAMAYLNKTLKDDQEK